MPSIRQLPPLGTALIAALIVVGCNSGDEKLVEFSRWSTERQAEQNRLVETNNRQVLEATNRLMAADARSRTENIALHRQIETERSDINRQRDALEQERRQIATERNRDLIIAESIRAVAGLIAAILPLLVCLFLLRGLFQESDQAALADLLIEDLSLRHPLLTQSLAASLPALGRDPRSPPEPTEEPQEC